ncbi:MAG: DUF2793 domain-containing protein [Alphaproteobacteria bacterium]
MSDTTAHLALPLVAAAQAQKHVTVNSALETLDALTQLSVISRAIAAPPGSPAEGDRYIIAPSATGAWAGKDGQIGDYDGGAWAFRPASAGWRAWIEDEGRAAVFDGTAWQPVLALSPKGATIEFNVAEEEVTLSGATTDTTAGIPARAIVFAVSVRTTQAITGATSYDCGIAGDTAKFGGTLSISAGSTNSGVVGPTAYYALTQIRLTANGSNFTAGKVRVAIHYMMCGAPAA